MPVIETARGKIWAALHSRYDHAPPAIFIHGAGGTHQSFPASLRQLRSIRPILMDLPGHGGSAGAGRQSIADYTLDVVALMDALAIDSAIVLGHSMGGAIAQQLALDHPMRVRALALVATGARLPVNPALISGIVRDTDGAINSLSRWMWTRNAPADVVAETARIMRGTPPDVIQGDLIACAKFDVGNRLRSISSPTLILAADKDKMTPSALSEELKAGITGSELAVVAKAGHMLQLEQPDFTADVIDQWLARVLK